MEKGYDKDLQTLITHMTKENIEALDKDPNTEQ